MDREIYIAENGLEHCSVCKEPLEQLLPEKVQALFGMTKHPRQCACIRERNAREEKERKEREHRQKVESNTSVCFEEKAMREWNFENDNGLNPYMDYAKNYVANWHEFKKEGHGLILWGGVGSGKSYMAACIANALLEQEVKVLMTNFATIINGIFSATDKNDYINAICGYDLLIIDDLGVESHSEYRMEGLFNVIDRRVRSGKPMIITTNLTMKEMDETQDLNEVRVYDRIRAVCQPVQIKGESQRKAGRSKMMDKFREYFHGEKRGGPNE
jgi:DNA replication protein DnaC